MNTSVAFFISDKYCNKIKSIAFDMPVWVLSSPLNDKCVELIRKDSNQLDISVIYPESNQTVEDSILDALYTIDELKWTPPSRQ